MIQRYEVQTEFIYGFDNCWTEDGLPVTFASQAEAQAALDEHLADLLEAEKAGDITDAMTAEQFRIVEVQA